MKHCVWCAEIIQDAALVCRYCRRDQEPAAPSRALRVLAWLLVCVVALYIVWK